MPLPPLHALAPAPTPDQTRPGQAACPPPMAWDSTPPSPRGPSPEPDWDRPPSPCPADMEETQPARSVRMQSLHRLSDLASRRRSRGGSILTLRLEQEATGRGVRSFMETFINT
jgi:hypothetical protein